MSQRFSRLILAVVSGLLAFGCSSHRQLAIQAVDFNLTVEKAQNEMLLLNVIRAKDRLPMYMTGIASLSGNVSTSIAASLPGTYTSSKGIGIDTITRSTTPSAGASMSANPTFSLAVLDTQEFMKGFLAPISTDLLAYYWNQGWPPDLLIYLLVQQVEIVPNSGGPTQVLRNYPDSTDPRLQQVQRFGCWLRAFFSRKPRLTYTTTLDNVGPQLSRDQVSDVENLIQVNKEGLVLSQVGNQEVWQLQRRRTELRFSLEAQPVPPPDDHPDSDCADMALSFDPPAPSSAAKVAEAAQTKEPANPATGKISTTLPSSTTFTFVLRSPEALVYYLGELMRVANRKESPKVPYFCVQGRLQPIFVALPAGRCKDTQVDADTGRGAFSVPLSSEPGDERKCKEGELQLVDAMSAESCQAGRSMQALRLLSQIMSLQKSAKDMPSSATVRLIN